jgi:hypothetical protein
MKKKYDKNFALKIINQYADSYNQLEKENNNLKNQINELKVNLNINKEIINSFFKKDKEIFNKNFQLLLNKNNEEIKLLNDKILKLTNENSHLKEKLIKYNNSINSYFNFNDKKDKTYDLKQKIFIFENVIKKKNSELNYLKKKLKSFQESVKLAEEDESEEENHIIIKELYVSEPNENLLIIYNDLLLYKIAYEKALKEIKENKEKIKKLEQKIRENKNPKLFVPLSNQYINEFILKQTRANWETDEWFAVLNYLNLTKDDIDNNCKKNVFYKKVLEAIELLNKILKKRNLTITELEKNNEKLKEKNKSLTEENLNLLKKARNLICNSNVSNFSKAKINNLNLLKNLKTDENTKKGIEKIILNNMMSNQVVKTDNSMVVENNQSKIFNTNSSISLSVSNGNENYTEVSNGNSISFNSIEDDVLKKLNLKNKNLLLKKIENNNIKNPNLNNSM